MNTKQHIDQILSSDPTSMDLYSRCLALIEHLYEGKQNTEAARNQNASLLRAQANRTSHIVGLNVFFENLASYCDTCVVDAYDGLTTLLSNNQLSVPLRMITLMVLSQYAPLLGLETSQGFIDRFTALDNMYILNYNDMSSQDQYFYARKIILEDKQEALEEDQCGWNEKSCQVCLLAANAENADAQFMYAEGHDAGYQYYGNDPSIAQEYYQKAADLGHEAAQERLSQYQQETQIIVATADRTLTGSPDSFHSANGSRSNSTDLEGSEQDRPASPGLCQAKN